MNAPTYLSIFNKVKASATHEENEDHCKGFQLLQPSKILPYFLFKKKRSSID